MADRESGFEILEEPPSEKSSPATAIQPSRRSHLSPSAIRRIGRSLRLPRIGRLLLFLGPAFVASVAYMDPGNYATNIQGGAKYGYTLLWVVFASNLMAMLIQSLSAKLGIATGRNLAEMCRDRFPLPVVWAMWLISEVVAMATDLAEFLGAALGFHLLFGVPLLVGGLLTGVLTFLTLALQRYGFRPIEAMIASLVGVVAVSYLIETVMVGPSWGDLLQASIRPGFAGTESVLLAVGILGATVMPHVIFLHSALVQNRILAPTPALAKRLFRFGIPFALVPLVMFTSRRDVMGDLRNHGVTTLIAWLVAALIIFLNGYLLWQTFLGG